uniref:Putative methyltransferase n=1 Tax=viral metagenome TaxID=1070528 RepID=A0A6M3XL30_9ZZZZ
MSSEEWYGEYYYTDQHWKENRWYPKKMLRPGDMDSAIAYALGYTSYQEVRGSLGPAPYFQGGSVIVPEDVPESTAAKQMETLMAGAKRIPKAVLSVGCGRGEIASALASVKIRTYATDPSVYLHEMIDRTMKEWCEHPSYMSFDRVGLKDVPRVIPRVFDTVIFCESLEHIPSEEFWGAWGFLKETLEKNGGLLIVTNWMGMHPINIDGTGKDHIARVDDELFGKMAGDAKETVYREGSHLVLRFAMS